MINIINFLRRSQHVRHAAFVLGAFHFLIQVFYWFPACAAGVHVKRDWQIYYAAGQLVRHGQSPFAAHPDFTAAKTPHLYLYSPQFASIMEPLSRLSPAVFLKLWYHLVEAAFWLFCIVLARLSSPKRIWPEAVFGWSLALAVTPGVYYSTSLGQADVFVWLLFALGIACRQPAWFAACLQIKPYFFWPTLIGAVRGGRRTAAAIAVTLIVGFGMGLAVCGAGAFRDWIAAASLVGSEGTFNRDNLSLSFAVLRLARLFGWRYTSGPLPEWAHIYLRTAAVAGPAAAVYLTRKMDARKAAVIGSLAAMLFSPICWTAYLVIGYALVAMWLRETIERAEAENEPRPQHGIATGPADPSR